MYYILKDTMENIDCLPLIEGDWVYIQNSYWIHEYKNNMVNPYNMGPEIDKARFNINEIKSYQDAINNIDKIDINWISVNPYINPTEEQIQSLELLKEMV